MTAPAFASYSTVRVSPYALVAIGVFAAAALWQAWIGLLGDVTWLIMLDERWFAGEKPYVDFLEINPPASLLIYAPEVALAKLLGVGSETVVSVAGFAIAAASLWLSAAILRRAGRAADVSPGAFAVIAFTLVFLPGNAFMERDVLATAFALPYLALAYARASCAPVETRHAVLAGLGVGLMIALKPPFALVAVLPAFYIVFRAGVRSALAMVEIPAAATVVALYGVVAVLFFPAYAENMLPEVVNVYLALRQGALELLNSEGGRDFLLLTALGVLLAREKIVEPLLALPALAALGAFLGYCAQGKGWLYQAFPAFAFAAIFAGLAFERAPVTGLYRVRAALALIVALACGAFIPRWGVAFTAGTLAAVALRREISAQSFLRCAAGAALGAAAAASYSGPWSNNALARALEKLKPHATVMAVTESFGFVHPMVRRSGAEWVQSVPNMVIASGARVLIDSHPGDAALAAKLKPYIAEDCARVVADIWSKRPDAIIVGPLNTRFHAAVWADPALQAAMSDYQIVATNDEPAHPGELWARKDLVALRPSFATDATP
jgi:hypothetical protein